MKPPKWPLIIELGTRPVGKGRPRFTRRGAVYTPQRTRKFEEMLGWTAKIAMGTTPPLNGPVSVSITAQFKHSNGLGLHTSLPDGDNCLKSICDALNNIVYQDDRQVCSIVLKKLTGDKDLVRIEVMPLVL